MTPRSTLKDYSHSYFDILIVNNDNTVVITILIIMTK